MISLRQALAQMRNKDHLGRFVPFSLRFVACDFTHKTGGELVDYKNVTLPYRERVELEGHLKAVEEPKGLSKTYRNKTTVTFQTSGGEFRQCHIDLITKFNDQTII